MSTIPIQKLSISTHHRNEMVEITDAVERAVHDSGVNGGLALVYVPHTTAGVTINENADPDVKHDMLAKLEQLIPQRQSYYQHAEGNSDSHLKASLMGSSASIFIDQNQLVLGRWQGIYLCEFDGPRTRQFIVKIIPDADTAP